MNSKIQALLVAAAVALVAPTAQAVPVKYELYIRPQDDLLNGWFIYDEATSTLVDYHLNYAEANSGYPTGDFLPPATGLAYANPGGFEISDFAVTGTTPVGTFNASLDFFQTDIRDHTVGVTDGPDSRFLVGYYLAHITYLAVPGSPQGSSGGFVGQVQGLFFSDGPVVIDTGAPEPTSSALLLAGLGLIGIAGMRRNAKTA